METQYCGKPWMKLVVPSSGSMIQRYSAFEVVPLGFLPSLAPDSSPRTAWSGYACRMMSMIADSAALSTCVTKSLVCLARISSLVRSSAERLMMLPARRAALTAILSIGCMGRVFYYGDQLQSSDRSVSSQPPGQHRRRRARHENHGTGRSAPDRAGEISGARGALDGDQRDRRSRSGEGPRHAGGGDRRLRGCLCA